MSGRPTRYAGPWWCRARRLGQRAARQKLHHEHAGRGLVVDHRGCDASLGSGQAPPVLGGTVDGQQFAGLPGQPGDEPAGPGADHEILVRQPAGQSFDGAVRPGECWALIEAGEDRRVEICAHADRLSDRSPGSDWPDVASVGRRFRPV
jgi:hypothetical protein